MVNDFHWDVVIAALVSATLPSILSLWIKIGQNEIKRDQLQTHNMINSQHELLVGGMLTAERGLAEAEGRILGVATERAAERARDEAKTVAKQTISDLLSDKKV
jgi:hypothetical protein